MRLARLRPSARPLLAVGVLVIAQIEIWTGLFSGPTWVHAVLSLAWTLPLAAGARWPLASSLTAIGAAAGDAFVDPGSGTEGFSLILAVVMAMWTLGGIEPTWRALQGGVAGFAIVLVLLLEDNEYSLTANDVLFVAVIVIAPWLAGAAVRERSRRAVELEDEAQRIEIEREERARAAVAAERARIARELHDVIAHSVSVMTVQAGAARMLLRDDPERARVPIATVEETGREALAETRRLLGILRADMAGERELSPQPGMAGLAALADQARAGGLEVELSVVGEERRLPPGIDLAAYRVLQEALTNVRKHSTASHARVRVEYQDDAIDLTVENDGVSRAIADGSGHGLIGMRERVALYDGTVDAGPRRPEGYAVRVTIPTDEGAR